MFPEQDRQSIERRFSEKFIPEPNSGCWLWTASTKGRSGYGQMMLRHRRGRPELAHRISYKLFKGDIGASDLVLHSCDIPCCVNPAHLRLGTTSDNGRDMIARNRGRGQYLRGEACAHAKLTDEQVIAIRRDGRATEEIAAGYGVSERHVLHIKALQRRGRSIEKVARILKR